jgi:ankyrin repeat protein
MQLALRKGYAQVATVLLPGRTVVIRDAGHRDLLMELIGLSTPDAVLEIEVLVKMGVSLVGEGSKMWTPLHEAASVGSAAAVLALAAGGADIEARTAYAHGSSTPLHEAAKRPTSDATLALLSVGANPRAIDGLGNTPLHLAARAGSKDCCMTLLNRGAEVNAIAVPMPPPAPAPGKQGAVAPSPAGGGARGSSTMISTSPAGPAAGAAGAGAGATGGLGLGTGFGAGLGAGSGSGGPGAGASGLGNSGPSYTNVNAPLAAAAAAANAAAEVSSANAHERRAPLHEAVFARSVECCRILIERGALVNIKDGEMCTPLMRAVQRPTSSSAATSAAMEALHCTEYLLSVGGDLFMQNKRGGTVLHEAARHGNAVAISMLMAKGSLIDAVDRRLQTALMKAVIGSHRECVELLLKLGASPHAEDDTKNTALHHAARLGLTPLVKVLAKYIYYILFVFNQKPTRIPLFCVHTFMFIFLF